jgi:hypothetical protein
MTFKNSGRMQKENGLGQHISLNAARDAAVYLLAPYYKDRKFCYTDIAMQFRDADELKQQPHMLPTLADLVEEMRSKLEWSIVDAS